MNTLLKLENLALFVLALYAFSATGLSWWWFAGLFFLPDISMVGYLRDPKTGAFMYNLFHHFGTAVVLFLLGKIFANLYLETAGSLFFAHSAFDRILGYGLKYNDRFQHTHLGIIGTIKNQNE